jgi:arylformamidase
MTNLIDISVPLRNGMPIWPGSTGFTHTWVKKFDSGILVNASAIAMDIHAGTHVDAPLHFIENGDSVDMISLDLLCGLVHVLEFSDVGSVTASCLSATELPSGVVRLLIKSRNSSLWMQKDFNADFTALTEDAAQWLVDKGIRLVGIDYLSVQGFTDPSSVHNILLNAGVVVLEGLNLSKVLPGVYELFCLPLKISGAEGAPARAVLRKIQK